MDSVRAVQIMVVEDDDAYLYLIQKAFSGRLERTRWTVTLAKDGQEAVEALFEEEKDSSPLPDMILLDWNLPKVSGIEVLRRVKEHDDLRKIPVLVFSSSEAEKDIHDAYRGHANGYITKPLGLEPLRAIVETIERFWTGVAQLPKVAR
jgi:CheY-like chemotaxis protein